MYNTVSDKDLSKPSHRRVGKGGVCLLWHRKFDKYVSPIILEDDRIIGIQIVLGPNNRTFVFQVYLPCINHPLSVYKDYRLNRKSDHEIQ